MNIVKKAKQYLHNFKKNNPILKSTICHHKLEICPQKQNVFTKDVCYNQLSSLTTCKQIIRDGCYYQA